MSSLMTKYHHYSFVNGRIMSLPGLELAIMGLYPASAPTRRERDELRHLGPKHVMLRALTGSDAWCWSSPRRWTFADAAWSADPISAEVEPEVEPWLVRFVGVEQARRAMLWAWGVGWRNDAVSYLLDGWTINEKMRWVQPTAADRRRRALTPEAQEHKDLALALAAYKVDLASWLGSLARESFVAGWHFASDPHAFCNQGASPAFMDGFDARRAAAHEARTLDNATIAITPRSQP